jgi:hypothetical protein
MKQLNLQSVKKVFSDDAKSIKVTLYHQITNEDKKCTNRNRVTDRKILGLKLYFLN